MLLRTVKHLFLWAIYTMAMLVITRWYPSHWDKTIESVVYQFFFFAGFAKKHRVFLERSPLTLPPNISHTPILWFRICGFIPASTVVSLPQYLCARGPAFDLKDHGGGNRSVFMGHVVGIPNVYLFYHPQNGNSTIINHH